MKSRDVVMSSEKFIYLKLIFINGAFKYTLTKREN